MRSSGQSLNLLSCNSKDKEVKWMKKLEEIAPYCSEYDDFEGEAYEVERDHGDALPFTRGFYLVRQLVGAMNPDDLDAMDECVPFTKWTLENMLGVELTREEYEHYFKFFKYNQEYRLEYSKMDRIKMEFEWDKHLHKFLTQRLARDIDVVQEFKQQLKTASLASSASIFSLRWLVLDSFSAPLHPTL